MRYQTGFVPADFHKVGRILIVLGIICLTVTILNKFFSTNFFEVRLIYIGIGFILVGLYLVKFIPQEKFNGQSKNFIFDMDGVISDTQDLQASNEEKLLRKYGIDMSADEITAKYAGVSDAEFFPKIFADHGKEINLEKVHDEKWEMIFTEARGNIKEVEGSVEFIKKLYNDGYKLAVASASIRKFIELVLEELELTKYFSVVVSGAEVPNGKPAPDIFLQAAKELGSEPVDCVVIEDGVNGMKAAKAANMKCIGLVSDKSKKYPADFLVGSFKEINLENIFYN